MNTKTYLMYLIWFCFTIYSNCKVSIPSFVHLCKQSDPDMDKCILNTVNELKPNLAKGIPEMRIAPLSPFKMEKISLKSASSELELTDVELENLMTFETEHFHFDIGTTEIEINLKFPKVDVKGKYKIKGHVMVFELNGGGSCVINLNNVSLKTKIYGKKTQKNGKEYFDYNNNDVDIQVSDGHLDFQDLFAGNKQLTDQTNKVLNENFKSLLPEVLPMISRSIKSVILSVVKNVYDSFPAEELLPK